MNIELEKRVMDALYLEQKINLRKHFFFNEIAELTDIRKSSLQRILARLVKREWIRKRRVIDYDENWIKNLKARKIKHRIGYKVIGYPYLEGLGGLTKEIDNTKLLSWNIPDGKKRFWKNSAAEIRELKNKFFRDEIKRINLWNRALARRYPYYYKFR